ncbi:hypothetical protein F4775DRAFT_543471 [Biscogniauxia sp. FL1348]|nr:hypothetical protein F4775DRAFT_543471 [Biscogniauxia sp. FL1348]
MYGCCPVWFGWIYIYIFTAVCCGYKCANTHRVSILLFPVHFFLNTFFCGLLFC